MSKDIIKFKNQVEDFKNKFLNKSSDPKSLLDKGAPIKILIDISSGIAVGGFLGYIIDDYFGTLPLMLFILTVFGMIGGVYNVYKSL